jgi:hypothetical protein
MTFGDPEELQAFRNVVATFEAEEPDVDVQLIEASDRDDLIARVSSSTTTATCSSRRGCRSQPRIGRGRTSRTPPSR